MQCHCPLPGQAVTAQVLFPGLQEHTEVLSDITQVFTELYLPRELSQWKIPFTSRISISCLFISTHFIENQSCVIYSKPMSSGLCLALWCPSLCPHRLTFSGPGSSSVKSATVSPASVSRLIQRADDFFRSKSLSSHVCYPVICCLHFAISLFSFAKELHELVRFL